ncbi:MAG TPA: cytochrome c [Microvirga sp.]|nr:cytochrome c [Microvirga sp.]
MGRTIFVAGALALGIGVALAQANVIAQRQELMKQNNAGFRTVARMLRGQAPFDLAQVQAALQNFAQVGQQFPTLFPDDSKTGGDTRALPAIWANKADFTALALKLSQDAQAAMATIRDEASFRTEMPKVLQTCDACHDKYRRPT